MLRIQSKKNNIYLLDKANTSIFNPIELCKYRIKIQISRAFSFKAKNKSSAKNGLSAANQQHSFVPNFLPCPVKQRIGTLLTACLKGFRTKKGLKKNLPDWRFWSIFMHFLVSLIKLNFLWHSWIKVWSNYCWSCCCCSVVTAVL